MSAAQEQDVLTQRERERERKRERAGSFLVGRARSVVRVCVCVCACVCVCGGGVGWVEFVCVHTGMGTLAMTIHGGGRGLALYCIVIVTAQVKRTSQEKNKLRKVELRDMEREQGKQVNPK